MSLEQWLNAAFVAPKDFFEEGSCKICWRRRCSTSQVWKVCMYLPFSRDKPVVWQTGICFLEWSILGIQHRCSMVYLSKKELKALSRSSAELTSLYDPLRTSELVSKKQVNLELGVNWWAKLYSLHIVSSSTHQVVRQYSVSILNQSSESYTFKCEMQ